MKKCFQCLFVLTIVIFLSACGGSSQPKENDLLQAKSTRGSDSKKVILIVADSLMDQAIDEGIRNHQLPTFKYMVEHGQYYKNVVSSFPTMSVTIGSSLVTGTYPDKHHVPGLIWYSKDEKRIVNYGTGPMEIWRQGVGEVLTDALDNLNGRHLNPRIPTIYEELDKHYLTSGSINGLIYRGTSEHALTVPAWIHWPTSLPKQISVKGPDFLAFGAFTNPLRLQKELPEGMKDKVGFNDEYAFEMVKQLIRTNQLPDFLYVYLSDMDKPTHRKGPPNVKGVKELDTKLDSLLQVFGSKEEAIKKAIIIVTGDSGVASIVPANEQPVINLPSFFAKYNVLRPGAAVDDETQIVLAVNETMAYVYKLQAKPTLREMAESLRTDPRIGLIAWKENGWINVMKGGFSKEFRYKPNGNMTDPYRQSWTLDGNPKMMDVKNDGNNHIHYGEYPDGLMRLSTALHSHDGDFLVVMARPGYELADRSSPTHKGGGGHGSLHAAESFIPMIICGTEAKPEHLRIVDMKKYLLHLLEK